jgi:hypothetical protein
VNIKDIMKLTEGIWVEWERDVQFTFAESGMLGYLDGTIEALETDRKKSIEWREYNHKFIGMLGRIVDDSLAQELDINMSAVEVWKLLKGRTHQEGMVAKLYAI